MSSHIDYYKILEIPADATQEQIRKAYKVQALKTHPDRVPADSAERPSRTRKFQLVNEAFRTLSNPTSRRDYDRTRPRSAAGHSTGTSYQDYASSSSNFPGFSGSRPSAQDSAQFSDIFEEMMQEEGFYDQNQQESSESTRNMFREGAVSSGRFWGILGAIAGAILGFIIANFAGMLAGLFAGNQLGAIRDKNKKSVYAVFSELPQEDKARVLSDLAAKVFAHAVSG